MKNLLEYIWEALHNGYVIMFSPKDKKRQGLLMFFREWNKNDWDNWHYPVYDRISDYYEEDYFDEVKKFKSEEDAKSFIEKHKSKNSKNWDLKDLDNWEVITLEKAKELAEAHAESKKKENEQKATEKKNKALEKLKTSFVIKCGEGLSFFISWQKNYNGDYTPTYTRIDRNNFSRMKIFDSEDKAWEFIDKSKKDQDYFCKDIDSWTVMSYGSAQELIGDSNAKYHDYKQKQEADRKQRAHDSYEYNKEKRRAKEEELNKKDPGEYEVQFKVVGSNWYDRDSFYVTAESPNDAWKKAKEKALQRDPNCNTPGYDHRLSFTKEFIYKR